MPTTYTQNNGLSKLGNGEGSGTWGTTANTVFDIIDRSISGVGAITLTGTTTTLATSDGVLSDGNYKVLVLGGFPSGANTITVTPSDAQKVYMVFNNTSESAVFTQGSGANVTITAGSSAMIYTDGGGSGAVVSDLTSQFRLSPVYDKLTAINALGVTATELDYVDGVTSNIQTQIDTKSPTANATLTGITTAADIRLSTGEQAIPSISFTGHTDTGMYLASEFTAFTHNGTACAYVDADGTFMTSSNAIVTREKGDARYLGLSGNASMSGDLNLSDNDILNVSRLELLAGTEGSPSTYFATDTDTGIYFTGTMLAFSNDGSQSATIEPAGTGLNGDNTIVTREKGDARYLELSGGTMTGNLDASDIRLSTGEQAIPSISFTGHTDTGMYLASEFTAFTHNGTACAYVDADGTFMTSSNAIVTREKGDARYLGLSGNASMSGDLNLSDNDILNVSRLELLAGTEGSPSTYFATDTDTGIYFTGTMLAFSNDGSQSATIEPAGTGLNGDNTIVTREKGDARYLELSGGTMTGNLDASDNDILNVSRLELLAGTEGSPSTYFATDTDTGIYFTGTMLAFSNDGSQSATIEPAGTGLNGDNTIVTREKGDARYSIKAPSAGSVGSYGMFKRSSSTSMSAGDTIAGSSLSYAGVSGGGTADSGTPTGTWRLMGHMGTSTSLVSVFVRIA